MDIIWSDDVEDSVYGDDVTPDFEEKIDDVGESIYGHDVPGDFDEKFDDVGESIYGHDVPGDFDEKFDDVGESIYGHDVPGDFDEKFDDVGESIYDDGVCGDFEDKFDDVRESIYGHVVPDELDERYDEVTSNDDEKSWSYGSGSDGSSKVRRNSRRGYQSDVAVLSKCDRSKSYPRCSSDRGPLAESEYRENGLLHLLLASGFPMTQVNGQRKLGPPPGWTEPTPDPSCEVFVGKIPRTIYEHDIYPVFQKIGQVYEIRLMMDFSGTNRGYCFVMFSKYEYAQRAVRELNNYEIRPGRRIGVVASINNCRLCIGQLPTDIESKLVIEKFYEITDEVSKVAVYKNMNGQVRCALVSYKNHRGAAMARRRLLPERASLFGRAEVTIDWAHPDMSPNNVVEESGVLDESGKLHFSTVTINHSTKRGRSQRRGRCDFLDKSIKNYLDEKSAGQPANQRRSPGGTVRVQRSLGRGNSFQSRRRGGRASSHQRKYFNPSPRGRGYGRQNIEEKDRRQNRSRSLPMSPKGNRHPQAFSYPADRDINGNVMGSKSAHQTHEDFYDQENTAADNRSVTLRTDPAIGGPREMNPLAKNFIPEVSCFNLFEQYALSSEKRAGNPESERSYDPSVANFFRTFETRSDGDIRRIQTPTPSAEERCANFAEFGKWNSTETFVPRLAFCAPTGRNDSERQKGGASERTKAESSKNATRNHPRKNFKNPPGNGNRGKNAPRVLNQITNWNGNCNQRQVVPQHFQALGKNQTDSVAKENFINCYLIPGPVPTLLYSQPRPENCRRDCVGNSATTQRGIQFPGIIALQQQQQMALPHCPQNDWRGSNCLTGNQLALMERRRQLPSFAPQSCFPTSAFADYYRSVLPQVHTDKNQIAYRPRPILNRFAALGENR